MPAKIQKSEAEWREQLSPEQYHVNASRWSLTLRPQRLVTTPYRNPEPSVQTVSPR
jgi:hypothetical protein